HARLRIRARHLGTERSRLASPSLLKLAEPDGETAMRMDALADADAVARAGAAFTAERARDAVAARGRFIMAVSSGHTPWQMLRALASENVPWKGVHLVQVDERIAPAGDPDRNLTHLCESLLEHSPLAEEQIRAMPVEEADIEGAARRYARTLAQIAGTRPRSSRTRAGRPLD